MHTGPRVSRGLAQAHTGCMTIPTGGYELTADNGQLLLHTKTDGKAAAMGHNLVIEVGQWSAQVEVGATPADSALTASADLGSLVILDGHGGVKPLGDGDREKILENAAKALDTKKNPTLTFTATELSGSWEAGVVRGELTLHGTTRPTELALDQPAPGRLRLSGTIVQSEFGIKPFSTMMGALKIKDTVDIEVSVPFE